MIHPGCKIVSSHTTVGMTWNYHLSPLHSMYRNYQANKPMKSMMKTPYIEHMGLVGDRIANHRHNGCSITKNGHTVVKAMMYIVVLRQQSKLLKIQALLSLCMDYFPIQMPSYSRFPMAILDLAQFPFGFFPSGECPMRK